MKILLLNLLLFLFPFLVRSQTLTTGIGRHQDGSYQGYKGDYSVNIGAYAGYSGNSGTDYNVAVGYSSSRFNTAGDYNAFLGAFSGYRNTTGSRNSFVGHQAGYNNTIGFSNTFIGEYAGRNNTIGFNNTFIGKDAGQANTSGNSNTFLGQDAGQANSTGSGNVFIGPYTGSTLTAPSNLLYIDNSGTTSPLIWGNFSSNQVKINGTLHSTGTLRSDGAIQIDGKTVIDDGGGWHRSHGSTGWYNQTYGGGIYMVDGTWIRTYGNKSFYHNTGTMRTDGTFHVGPNGNRFYVDGSGNSALSGNFTSGGAITSTGNGINIRGSYATIHFNDTDDNADEASIHLNSGWLYFLGHNNSNTDSHAGGWDINGSNWPLRINISNDDIEIGGNTYIQEGNLYGKSLNNSYTNLYKFGGIYFTWDSDSYGTNTHHSIRSTYGDSYGEHLTMNSFGHIRFNFDSNNNGTNVFQIGNATTGTGNVLFHLNESGQLGLGLTDPSENLDISGTARLRGVTQESAALTKILAIDDNGKIFWKDGAEIGSDNQDLELSGNVLSLTNDATAVNLSGYLDNTDAQDLDLTGNTLSLTNDATTVDLSSFLDNTDAQTASQVPFNSTSGVVATDVAGALDEINTAITGANTDNQDLELTGNTLSLTNDATTVDLSGYLDNTDNQTAPQVPFTSTSGIVATEVAGAIDEINTRINDNDAGRWSQNNGNISFSTGQVSIGTTEAKPNYELSVAGEIVAEEVLIEYRANWPDYVFDEEYELLSIIELKRFIDANKHLPNVPSANEVIEEGIAVGQMNKILLEKVEELTLYIIDQSIKLQVQKELIDRQESNIETQSDKLILLENKFSELSDQINNITNKK